MEGTRPGHCVGETVNGREVGLNKKQKYAWVECPTCHKQRWALMRDTLSPTKRLCKDPCLADFNRSIFKINPESSSRKQA